jgi:DNA-binding LacI/PurR family transcriptional regulator
MAIIIKANLSMKKVKSMKDIAILAGVSEGTVSRALKNSALISQKVKDKITKIADEHNYSPNKNATNLSTQKSNAIVVIVNQDINANSFSRQPFILDMLGVLADELAKKHMEMILSPERNITGCWNNYFIRSKRADGLIILGPGSEPSLFDDLTDHKVPFVVWGGKDPAQEHCAISGDNKQGGLLAVKHLIKDASRKRIILLGPRHTLEGNLRYQGYCEGIRKYKCDESNDLLIECDWSTESAFEKMQEIIKLNKLKFDAVFALNDTIAYGAIKAIQANGFNVPKDISVVGYDDIQSSQLITPPLTTVRQNTDNAVPLLVERITALINGETASSEILDAKLIIRESSVEEFS